MTETQRTVPALVPPRSWNHPDTHVVAAAELPWYHMLTRLYSTLLDATNRFYADQEVTPVLLPITVSSVSSPMGLGSDSLPVRTTIMGESVYLADSMQFQLEFMLRHGLSGAYYVMPSFRGEDPDETHLNQFFHSEAEIVGGLEDVMALVERYLQVLARRLVEDPVSEEIGRTAGTLDHLHASAASSGLPRITFEDAFDLLGPQHFEERVRGVPVITRAGETALIEHFGGGGVWLTHPPHLSVPFYQRRDSNGRAQCADLLLGVGEIVGCGARHIYADEVREALADHEIDAADYDWYIRMRERNPMATAGFGLGLERYLLWVLDHNDIRDLHVMPRIKGMPTCP